MFSDPVTYSHKKTDELNEYNYKYRFIGQSDDKTLVRNGNGIIYCSKRADFYELLNYWNSVGYDWKYWSE